MASEPPKVFISYNRADRDWAEWIGGLIKGAGYQPILDVWHFQPGENFVLRMQEAATQADVTLALLSEAYLQAIYTQPEWAAAFAQDPIGKGRRLIPVRVGECSVTGLLAPILHINLVGLGEQDAKRALLDGLKPSGEPAQPPAFPGPRATPSVPPARFPPNVARLHGVSGPGVFLPPPPHDFVGRTETLEMLYAALAENPGSALLHGEPGCGKSTLALKFAWVGQGAFDAVVFQLCGQRPVAEVAGELAAKLKLGVETKPPEEQIAAVKAWLGGRRALLVLDDIWENDVIALATGPPVSLLCTSRRRSLPGISPTYSLEVKSFSRGEAESIFRTYLGEETLGKHRDALLEFAERVERLPIAIVVGADVLRHELDPVPEAARGLRLERLSNEVHDVAALLRLAITARPEEQRRLLNAMAVCALEGFWLPLTVEIAGLTKEQGGDARNRLVDASLLRMLDRDRQRFQLHALLREELRNLAPLRELQAAHAAVLERLFMGWEGRWRECSECLPEVIPAVQHLWEKSESSRAAWLTDRGFATGRRIGELEIALRIVQQQEALCLELSNKDGLQISYGNQALILQAWGRLEEAMALLKKQEALCLELGNKDGLQISYGNQALILQAWGRLEEAMALHKKEEALCLELGNKEGLQRSYGNQAVILRDWGRLEEAMALHKKQEALCLELDNKGGLEASYGNQAAILLAWGQLEEAMALLKKVEALSLELGNKDSLQRSYGNQAVILRAWGRLEEAMALLKKQETLCLELDNKDSLQISYGNQAAILQGGGRLEEAMALHKKEEALCLKLGNKDSLQRSYGSQALILQAWGQLGEAMALLKKQEALCLELGNRSGLAYCYWAWGLLAREQRDHKTERQKLAAALNIFTELNMPRERDAVRAELEKTAAADRVT